ncbi:thioredoxin 1 [Symbiobacterium terraclitae]|uniref:Thioredoxin n=1 Tax=Symbiobacterium terraclitae TaxID=557451 RepID=A0ABS4JTT0_9FIRM|nr:thioredoxin 1 [Symbiobacterium terraclitae]
MASEKVITLSAENWAREVEQSTEPVLVDFWAVWCGPCRMIAPVVEEIAADYEGRLKVGKLNVDENNELAARYGVVSIPTLLVFKNGQPVERIVGFQPKKELAAKIDRALA